jgi:hypothetical protein
MLINANRSSDILKIKLIQGRSCFVKIHGKKFIAIKKMIVWKTVPGRSSLGNHITKKYFNPDAQKLTERHIFKFDSAQKQSPDTAELFKGLKYYPWGDNESLRWQPGIGAQYCWYTIGLFSMDRYTSLVAPASIPYSGKKGFHFAVDAGSGITRVTRVKSWGSHSSNQDGVYGCFSFSFRVGYRFRRPGY